MGGIEALGMIILIAFAIAVIVFILGVIGWICGAVAIKSLYREIRFDAPWYVWFPFGGIQKTVLMDAMLTTADFRRGHTISTTALAFAIVQMAAGVIVAAVSAFSYSAGTFLNIICPFVMAAMPVGAVICMLLAFLQSCDILSTGQKVAVILVYLLVPFFNENHTRNPPPL